MIFSTMNLLLAKHIDVLGQQHVLVNCRRGDVLVNCRRGLCLLALLVLYWYKRARTDAHRC
jgi:hypothetical protein